MRLCLLTLARVSLVLTLLAAPLLAASAADQVSAADQAVVRSLADHNHSALDRLLDPDFTWIGSKGERFDRSSVLRDYPRLSNAQVPTKSQIYGKAAVIRADLGQLHVMRIWVKRAAGWRLLLYQEVAQVAISEKPPGGSGECDNPCRTIPFVPKTAGEKAAIASWQGVMRAMADNDADAYAALIADEFTATDTHHSRPFTKSERIAQIRKLKLTGRQSTPSPLLSARMFDLGQTVLMIAREQRPQAKPYFNTRMWVYRDGRWQMLFSFNTRIEQDR